MSDPFDELKQYLETQHTHTMLNLVLHSREQPVMVRSDITVRKLLDSVKRKLDREEQEKHYSLYLNDERLPMGRTIAELQRDRVLTPASKVVMRVVTPGTKAKGFQLVIVDPTAQKVLLVLDQFPVVIGRRTPDTPDVQDLSVVGGNRISRRHAEIIDEDGRFQIKCLSERGLTLNGKPLAESESSELTFPSQLQLGKTSILRIEQRRILE